MRSGASSHHFLAPLNSEKNIKGSHNFLTTLHGSWTIWLSGMRYHRRVGDVVEHRLSKRQYASSVGAGVLVL